jgi:hypothetical protein
LISRLFAPFPLLLVVGGYDKDVPDTFVSGHCASKALCFRQNNRDPAALLTSHHCPGCAQGAHEECGYYNPRVDDKSDEITCLSCFNKFGRVLGKDDDPDYIPKKSGLTDPSKTPSRSTRSVEPTGGRASLNPKVPSPEKTISAYWREKQEVTDAKIDESNPSYMYERDKDEEEATAMGVLWYDDEDFTTVEIQHLAEAPVDTHIYSTKEMREFSSTKENKHYEQSMNKKHFNYIINAAYSLERFLEKSSGNEAYPRPPHLHVPEKDYSAQDLVNICCLVDRGCEFVVDALFVQKRKTKFSLRIDSYLLETNRTLKSYANSRSKKNDPPNVPVFMEVYRSWLKKYLDWFDPDLHIYVLAHSDGMTVERIRNQLASKDPVGYQMSSVKDVDPLMVPLPKMHEIINTGKHSFGVTVEGKFTPYCKNTFTTIPEFSQDVVQPLYDEELTKSCNPPGFEEVPVARMPTAKVPLANMQITGIRANTKVEGGETTLRWLGLQDGKYVSLPSEWV